jgi:hypothetical protein
MDRVDIILSLVRQRLVLQAVTVETNTLETTVDIEDAAQMRELNEARRRLAEAHIRYGSILNTLCEHHDQRGTTRASVN